MTETEIETLIKEININISNDEIRTKVIPILQTTKEAYILVTQPDVQEYMTEDWFETEAILYQAIRDSQEQLDSAYFIPLIRVINNS